MHTDVSASADCESVSQASIFHWLNGAEHNLFLLAPIHQ